jgi:hypothetical protein
LDLLRYGIMEKLRRLQAGEDVEDLLAEIGRQSHKIFIHSFLLVEKFSSFLHFSDNYSSK